MVFIIWLIRVKIKCLLFLPLNKYIILIYICACACSYAQSCPNLWDPMDCSLHSPVKILEWVAIPPPGDLPSPGIEPMFPASPALADRFFKLSHLRSSYIHILNTYIDVCMFIYLSRKDIWLLLYLKKDHELAIVIFTVLRYLAVSLLYNYSFRFQGSMF